MRSRHLLLAFALVGLAGCNGLRAHQQRPPELAVKGDKDANGQLASRDKAADRAKASGVLAGSVVDSTGHRCPSASLEITPLASGGAFHANADENGYFVIQGLEAGKQYKIAARTKAGEDAWAGATLVQPPNVVVLIKLNERLPEAGEKDAAAGPQGKPGPARLGAPRDDAEPVPLRPESVTKEDNNRPPPLAQIPGPGEPPADPNAAPPNAPRISATETGTPTRHEAAFAAPLKTLDGAATTLGAHRKPLTLVLLWTTASSASAEALPSLAELDRQYGDKGLSVVAIAYEDGKPAEVAERLGFQADRLRLKFPMLLGGGDSCPLLRLLDVRRYPTLVLFDETGQALWRGERLKGPERAQLEEKINARIGK